MYYNELDPYALEWIAQLARCGTLKAGELDGRDIKEVRAADFAGHERCHFFAGIGGWEYALMLAGWRGEVWTGSCPCQPFSQAGKRKGTSDERHLWPVWRDLIAECRPPVVFGEQVASPLGREWLSGVRAEMEALGYEVGAADLCAASVGAPHIRQRLFWVAYLQTDRRQQERQDGPGSAERAETEGWAAGLGLRGAPGGLGNTMHPERGPLNVDREDGPNWQDGRREETHGVTRAHGEICPWDAYDLIPCADGKARRIEPGTFPLAHGVPNRVGRLRAYGNAIVPQVASTFVRAFMDADKASTSAEQAERAGGA